MLWWWPVLFAIGSVWPWPAHLDPGPLDAMTPAMAAWGHAIAMPTHAAGTLRALELLWAAGALGGLLRLAWHYRRLMRDCRPVPAALLAALAASLGGLDPRRLFLHEAGPAVLWAPHSRLLLPADMLDRFNADQRRQILRHEQAHLRRGDALWSLLADTVFALLWFHPLAGLPCRASVPTASWPATNACCAKHPARRTATPVRCWTAPPCRRRRRSSPGSPSLN
jgi:beta-lactamase regulating signal transducer with metallopeptidase domain